MSDFKKIILQGIPDELPSMPELDKSINHAPKRKDILTNDEKRLAVRNALRYFPAKHHEFLAKEFAEELEKYGHIYMYRYRPTYKITARSIEDFPYKSKQAAAMMLMISNNLDVAVAQHPDELIVYGGNGSIFQNWAQYLLTMKMLAEMTDEQTLVMYSGNPIGLFPSHKDAPRAIITNGMMIPHYSSTDDYVKYYGLGVTQYGQMTAGSWMYIGPQGIVHGTTITVMNAARLHSKGDIAGKVYVTSGLGGMSGAQGKASVIAGAVGVIAEINPKAIKVRYEQGWIDEVYTDLDKLIQRIQVAREKKEAIALAYQGNVVDLWEKIDESGIVVELGSDQTSLHNPWAGGYYPVGLSLEESNQMMADDPEEFKKRVEESLRRHVAAVNRMAAKGMYFWDYGNAFLLQSGRAGADIFKEDGLTFKYPSYVQDIMGPLYFDYGFGPFRWVCTSSKPEDLEMSDKIAAEVLEEIAKTAPEEIQMQLKDNIHWIKEAGRNKMVVGSQARILYADSEGRIKVAKAFNDAIREGVISAPIVLGRDHHDVSGTDSPYRETSNIYDGSQFTADMAVHNVIGDSFRGATWVSIHNGGGVGWGEVINGGFGMVIDGSEDSERRLKSMLFWDVNNGIARRSWARNANAISAIKRAMDVEPRLKVNLPNIVNDDIINKLF